MKADCIESINAIVDDANDKRNIQIMEDFANLISTLPPPESKIKSILKKKSYFTPTKPRSEGARIQLGIAILCMIIIGIVAYKNKWPPNVWLTSITAYIIFSLNVAFR